MLILIDEIYWTNLKFEFGFEYLFWTLYIYEYLHLCYFCFFMVPFYNSFSRVRIYDTWSMRFHGGKWDTWWHWICCSLVGLFGYMFYFPLLFGFIFIGVYKYLFVYIYSLYIELDIEQTKKFCLNKNEQFNKYFFNKNNSSENILFNKSKFFLIKIQKSVFRTIKFFFYKIQQICL